MVVIESGTECVLPFRTQLPYTLLAFRGWLPCSWLLCGHPSDVCYNAINQQFWLQYCNQTLAVFGIMDAHLITPSDTSKGQAKWHLLVPNRAWANLAHSDTYNHGPFEFAIVWGHKTCDQIGQEDWDALAQSKSMFSNPLPCFNIPAYSIHVDWDIHTVIPSAVIISHVPHGD